MGDRHYNRMKYYSSLKTNAMMEERRHTSNFGPNVQGWLDIPEHMLQIQEEAFVPSYGGKFVSQSYLTLILSNSGRLGQTWLSYDYFLHLERHGRHCSNNHSLGLLTMRHSLGSLSRFSRLHAKLLHLLHDDEHSW